tara:strand:+ start:10232 stop:11419 length:1188 start_codon:yes stop_codon:yes gene_type:complete
MKKNTIFIVNTFKTLSLMSTISIIMLFGFEYTFRIFKYAKNAILGNNFEKYNSKDLIKAYDNNFRIEQILEMQRLDSVRTLQYKPWLQIGNSDHKHKYSIVKNGKRETYKSKIKCSDYISLWFFGGSTMFGTGTKWSSSIPSEFVKVSERDNKCIKAINFGIPYHYSLQEVINFSVELAKGKLEKPDYAIFLDGLNDFGQPGSTIRQEPFFTPVISSVFKATNDLNKIPLNLISFNFQSVRFLQRKILNISKNNSKFSYTNRSIPIGYDNEKAAIVISKNILSSSIFLEKVCRTNQIKCFHYLQPVAAIKYNPNGEKLTSWIEDERIKNRYRLGYKKISEELKQLEGKISYKFVDISYLFQNYKGIPYIDGGHYSPRANRLIAEKMYEIILMNQY